MSNDIQKFEHPVFGSVRVTIVDGVPWFYATDVASALGYENPGNAINTHCKKTCKISQLPETGNRPPVFVNIIPESDVYRLVMRSRLSGAERFQDWVCEDVLPSIRKTGSYCIAGIPVPNFDNPAAIARAWADMYEAKLEADKQAQLAIEARDYAIAAKGRIVAGRDQRLMQQRHDDMRTIRRKDERNGKLEAMYAEQGIELGAERMRADKAENDLGIGKMYKCAANIAWFKDYFDYKNCVAEKINGQAGRQLRILSDEMGYGYRVVPGHKYDTKAYHVDVIAAFRLRLDQNPKLMEKWRKHD